MNRKRRIIVLFAALLSLLMLFFPPYIIRINGSEASIGRAFLFTPPGERIYQDMTIYATVDIALLIAQWVMVLAVAAAFWLLADKK